MENEIEGIRSQCSCGLTSFGVSGPPLMRIYCHCSLCQKFTNADFADVSVFYTKQVGAVDESKVNFKFYKKPQLVSRGTCIQCNRATIETINIPLMPKLITFPSENIMQRNLLPEPSMHIFYDKRVEDHTDSLPKYHGFLSSQLNFGSKLISAMIRK